VRGTPGAFLPSFGIEYYFYLLPTMVRSSQLTDSLGQFNVPHLRRICGATRPGAMSAPDFRVGPSSSPGFTLPLPDFWIGPSATQRLASSLLHLGLSIRATYRVAPAPATCRIRICPRAPLTPRLTLPHFGISRVGEHTFAYVRATPCFALAFHNISALRGILPRFGQCLGNTLSVSYCFGDFPASSPAILAIRPEYAPALANSLSTSCNRTSDVPSWLFLLFHLLAAARVVCLRECACRL